MVQRVLVKVERSNLSSPTSGRIKVFECVVQVPDSLQVPYDSLYSSLLFLYGFDCYVTFELVRSK